MVACCGNGNGTPSGYPKRWCTSVVRTRPVETAQCACDQSKRRTEATKKDHKDKSQGKVSASAEDANPSLGF